ncbi:hypothetical protein EFR42_05555 [Lactobacillus delbrueckii]|nr:hypothetical protein [Lactobacillus delbrueckii]MCT3492063.1 hypothetical protein [Lactobacillus delbrueckii]
MKKIVKVLAICLCLFLIIDSGLYILFDFECIGALIKLLGVKPVISVILRWIIIVVAILLIVKYDVIFDYAFRSHDDASVNNKTKNN